jgi:tetratricopeptide (TPR) repeat protein
VGRGIYQALRANPDCTHGDLYARLLKELYPHYVSELASQIVMLDKKDVEVPYLDRKVNCLKVFALMEPDNPRIPREIGTALLDRGLRLSALQNTTVTLYRAESFLRRSLQLGPDDSVTHQQLGEVCYILGKYAEAAASWRAILEQLSDDQRGRLEERLLGLEEGRVPRVPAVDYLQAIGVALDLQEQGEDEEAAAILRDVLDDDVFFAQFPLPQIHYLLGLSCVRLGMPRYAEEYLAEAVRLDPDYGEARAALAGLTT